MKPEESASEVSMRYLGIFHQNPSLVQSAMFWSETWCKQRWKTHIAWFHSVWASLSLALYHCNWSITASDSKDIQPDWLSLTPLIWAAEAVEPRLAHMMKFLLYLYPHATPQRCQYESSPPQPPLYLLKRRTGQMDTDASMSVSWQTSLFCRSRRPARIHLKYLEQKGCLEFEHSIIQLWLDCRWKIQQRVRA